MNNNNNKNENNDNNNITTNCNNNNKKINNHNENLRKFFTNITSDKRKVHFLYQGLVTLQQFNAHYVLDSFFTVEIG